MRWGAAVAPLAECSSARSHMLRRGSNPEDLKPHPAQGRLAAGDCALDIL